MQADELIVRTAQPLNAETPLRVLGRSYVTPTELFFVRNHGPVPAIDDGEYRLTLRGEVHEPLVLSLPELRDRFPRATVAATLTCAGNRRAELSPVPDGIPWGAGAIGNAVWTGVRLGDLLRAAEIPAEARDVAFAGLDQVDAGGRPERFEGSIPLEKALAPEVLLAYEMNGEPLRPEHGFPLRAVVPGYVGARSVKWLSEVCVRRVPSTSFFQTEDYALAGQPLGEATLNSAICEIVPGPKVAVEGYAVGGGGRPLVRVEVSGDGGATWSPAFVRETGEPWTWRLWHAELELGPDPAELVVRAWDSSSAGQPEAATRVPNPRGYMNNAWQRMPLTSRHDEYGR